MNRKVVAAAVASALALPMAAHAVKFKTSGQVNRALQFQDDGVGSQVDSVDAGSSNTRFRFTGSEDIGNGMTAGVNLEFAAESNASNKVTNKQEEDGDQGVSIRHANVYFAGNFGKVTLGQGSEANDGVAYADLNSGAWLGGIENTVDFGGDLVFRGPGVGNPPTGIQVDNVVTSYDGGRTDNVRYDTPAIGPLTASVSVGTDSAVRMMVQASGPAGGAGQYDLRGGWSNGTNESAPAVNVDDSWVISGGFKANQGTGIALAYGSQAFDVAGAEDGTYYYVKLFHDWGNNSVAIDYRANEDAYLDAACTGGSVAARACGGTAIGIGFSHTIPRANVDLYTSYRLYTLEDYSGAEDISVFVVGSRIKFD